MKNIVALWVWLFLMALVGCGPNVLTAKGKVMNPLVKDSEELAFIRQVTIVRKEPRVKGAHLIVGNYRKPRALGELHETAELPHQYTDGDGLIATFEIYSIYKDELADFSENYTFWIVLPDGRRIKGETHRIWGLVNMTEKVTGGSMQPHLVVRDKSRGTTKTYHHWEEVENEYELFYRKARIIYKAKGLITLDTPKLVLEVHGGQRIRRYTFELTSDPTELMDKEEKEAYLKGLGRK